jgi:hypothetical protein
MAGRERGVAVYPQLHAHYQVFRLPGGQDSGKFNIKIINKNILEKKQQVVIIAND